MHCLFMANFKVAIDLDAIIIQKKIAKDVKFIHPTVKNLHFGAIFFCLQLLMCLLSCVIWKLVFLVVCCLE